MTLVHTVNYNTNDVLKEFGISVGDTFLNNEARILEPPMLKYRDDEIQPKFGAWNSSNKKFIDPKNLVKWAILNLNKRLNRNDIF